MARTFLMLGGNLGNRHGYLEQARSLIENRIGFISLKSSVYETEPWGFTDENLFLNQAIEVCTSVDPFEVLAQIKRIETFLGRKRSDAQYSSRTIDIDILLYDELIINDSDLSIPHPKMDKRKFVLKPLAEIAAELIHPVFQKSIGELLLECTDRCKVRKV